MNSVKLSRSVRVSEHERISTAVSLARATAAILQIHNSARSSLSGADKSKDIKEVECRSTEKTDPNEKEHGSQNTCLAKMSHDVRTSHL